MISANLTRQGRAMDPPFGEAVSQLLGWKASLVDTGQVQGPSPGHLVKGARRKARYANFHPSPEARKPS